METRKKKEYLNLPPLEPYSVIVYDSAKIKTIDQLLKNIFSVSDIKVDPDKDEIIEINKKFLMQLAYGIQGIKGYDPHSTPEKVREVVRGYMQNYTGCINAGLYFLSYFDNATRLHGWQSRGFTSSRSAARISPRKSVFPLSFCPTVQPNDINLMIDARTNDIRLMNLSGFMRLYRDFIEPGYPIPEKNILFSYYNNLYDLIIADIHSVKEDHKLLAEKIKIYLAIAKKLATEKPIIDLQGAGTIIYPLRRHDELFNNNIPLVKEFNKLLDIFSENMNFKNLRAKMEIEACIPPIWVLTRDIAISDEIRLVDKVTLMGHIHYFIFEKIMTLKSEDERKPLYQTDLLSIFDGYSLYYSFLPPLEKDISSLRTHTGKGLIYTVTGLYFFNKAENTCVELDADDDDLKKIKNDFPMPRNTSRLLTSSELNILHSIKCCALFIPYQNNVTANNNHPIKFKKTRAHSLTGTAPLKNTQNTLTTSTAGISKSLNKPEAGLKTKLSVKKLSLETLPENKKIQEDPAPDKKDQSAINSSFFSSRLTKRGRRCSAPDKFDSHRQPDENLLSSKQNRI